MEGETIVVKLMDVNVSNVCNFLLSYYIVGYYCCKNYLQIKILKSLRYLLLK